MRGSCGLGVLSDLRDLDVHLLGKLRHQEVVSVSLGVDLHVQLEPGDGRLRTEVPLQRLQGETNATNMSRNEDTATDASSLPVHVNFTECVHVIFMKNSVFSGTERTFLNSMTLKYPH